MQNEEQLSRITQKIQHLVRKHEAVVKENEKLKRDAELLRLKMEEQTQKITNLEQSVAVLKTLPRDLSVVERKELEKRLNQYIREIERCITMLSE